jgi:preprotein translocase subunit SecD
VYFRSVLCFAPSYNRTVADSGPLSSASCSAASRLDEANLGVTPDANSASGFSEQNVAPDAGLAGLPSTSAAKETAEATVLLPGFSAPPYPGMARYVLGPAEMTSASVARASASKNQTGAWVVDYTMNRRGSALWDKVVEENFHKYLGIDFDGKVISAPIIQPTQDSFSTFNGRGEISGNLTKVEALELARALHHG